MCLLVPLLRKYLLNKKQVQRIIVLYSIYQNKPELSFKKSKTNRCHVRKITIWLKVKKKKVCIYTFAADIIYI